MVTRPDPREPDCSYCDDARYVVTTNVVGAPGFGVPVPCPRCNPNGDTPVYEDDDDEPDREPRGWVD